MMMVQRTRLLNKMNESRIEWAKMKFKHRIESNSAAI